MVVLAPGIKKDAYLRYTHREIMPIATHVYLLNRAEEINTGKANEHVEEESWVEKQIN